MTTAAENLKWKSPKAPKFGQSEHSATTGTWKTKLVYEITSTNEGQHLTVTGSGQKQAGGWTTHGTYQSLGLFATVTEAKDAAQQHFNDLMSTVSAN